ncbi:hypothetical protein Q1695_003418 [Nippostrongylus brasiliensis]|nr:hypothetical protein Q1695_003418 [Nippostrongylus brasiliensis]
MLDRRTHENIIQDARANRNGQGGDDVDICKLYNFYTKRSSIGLTQMMDLFTMERCRLDVLHASSEGITCDLIRELFSSKRRVPELQLSTASKTLISKALQLSRNHTYASNFVLGLKDHSKCTASEKDAARF